MQPVQPDLFVSHREKHARDALMDAIRVRIAERRIPARAILSRGKPMYTSERARILRGEYENFSMRRAFLLADAVGIDDRTLMKAMVPDMMEEPMGELVMPELPEIENA